MRPIVMDKVRGNGRRAFVALGVSQTLTKSLAIEYEGFASPRPLAAVLPKLKERITRSRDGVIVVCQRCGLGCHEYDNEIKFHQ